ncbi:SH3 domain-containing protein [Actinoallomurus purpureus]|uniref:SH3 domain-containing protein n=1 Tax=Actinoallomurus purpureus TaxID=478114 RepID=UPI0020927C8F|nr:SH3 domain-containing protein [Actinoallomurus purpureus]MCO6004478.1 SH3 domain-containing protein [Actinoallomurus purpureus]
MKNLLLAAVIAGTAITGATAVPAYASTASVQTAPVKYEPCKAWYAVKIRSKASQSSTAIGVIPKGKKALCNEKPVRAKKFHSGCFRSTPFWTKVNYKTKWGYVSTDCMH